MTYTFKLFDLAKNKIVEYQDPYDYDDEGIMLFQWLENNYSCDCNRGMFMYDKEHTCGEDIALLEIKRADGTIIDVAAGGYGGKRTIPEKKLRIKMHRGSLDEAMKTAEHIAPTAKALIDYLVRNTECLEGTTLENIEFSYSRFDKRIGWDITWILVNKIPWATIDRNITIME